jgi:hypothetical protein
MSPLREARTWTSRFEDDVKIDPLKRYYMIFEGANTEKKYFHGIEEFRKELGISTQIELVILHKEAEIRDYSHPHKLLELINEKKKELKKDGKYDKVIDQFVIVFDRDSFEKEDDFFKFLNLASTDNILTITSPCFEIWLILHYENAICEYIEKDRQQIFENAKVSNAHTFMSRLFSEVSGMNPKSGLSFVKLKDYVDLAIKQEKELQHDNYKLASDIGSNVGILIEQMRQDPRKSIL